MAGGDADLGVCVCGSGNGIAMAANKIAGVRAAVAYNVTSARLARAHNDANVLCIGERLTGAEVAREALDAWLAASFDGGRHEGRVAKLDALGAHRLITAQRRRTRRVPRYRSRKRPRRGARRRRRRNPCPGPPLTRPCST